MKPFERREFLSQFSVAVGAALIPFSVSPGNVKAHSREHEGKTTDVSPCWLDVSAPFVIEDPEIGMHTEIVLTSDTFVGSKGHDDGVDSTEYEIFLYELNGKPIGTNGVATRLTVPAMQTTVLRVRDIVGDGKPFFGGATIRLRPRVRTPMHASDLFSSAYLRLTTSQSFDNVHANPDPLQWKKPTSFFYSMPFPSLREYECIFSLFNPNPEPSVGTIMLYDQSGRAIKESPYELNGHSSLIFDLRERSVVKNVRKAFASADKKSPPDKRTAASDGGTIAVLNKEGSVKSFGYLFIKRLGSPRFSIDHPIHQSPSLYTPAKPPFDDEGRFKAKNILYTPLLFRSTRIGGITINSKFHLSSGAPAEEHLWLNPYVVDQEGSVVWQPTADTKLPASISSRQIERGRIKLGRQESCVFDPSLIALPNIFSGGLSLAISPLANHTLMKVELTVSEWGAHAFTHFRPGVAAARAYQKPAQRGGLVTDYITSAARLESKAGVIVRDEIVCVINIDDRGLSGEPTLEVFSRNGMLTRVKLGEMPSFSCRHFLLSEMLPGKSDPGDLTLRLVDNEAILLLSVVHIDHVRRDIALDHGSDRFSTFQEFNCERP